MRLVDMMTLTPGSSPAGGRSGKSASASFKALEPSVQRKTQDAESSASVRQSISRGMPDSRPWESGTRIGDRWGGGHPRTPGRAEYQGRVFGSKSQR